jgi:translation elongation factor EF-Tu-like GTPase
MAEKPLIEAEVTFLSPDEGGRVHPPNLLAAGRYMPHLVVQEPDVRKAKGVQGNLIQEDYLGVAFLTGPSEVLAGRLGRFTLELMYHPHVEYDAFQAGATFTVREGGKIVGFGRVIGRVDPEVA